MDIEQAQTVIAALCLNHRTFRPHGEPTLTPTGAKIEFMKLDVDPKTIWTWFEKAGATATLLGVKDVYARVPTMVCEFRL